MSASDWVSVGEYSNLIDARLVSRQLHLAGIPNRIEDALGVFDPGQCGLVGHFAIWVSSDKLDEATRILAEQAISDDELTKLALGTPPPDDF